MVARLRNPEAYFPVALAGICLVIGLLAGRNPGLGLGVALGIVFVIVVLSDLRYGVWAMAFLAVTETLPSFGALSLAKAAGVILAISWMATVSRKETRGKTLLEAQPVLTLLLACFLAWSALTLVWAESTSEGVTALTRYAPNLLLFPIIFSALRRRGDVVAVLGTIVVAGALAAAMGVASPTQTEGDLVRATGTVGDANELAAALVVGLVLAMGFAVNRGFSGEKRLLCGLVAALAFAGILLSLSRGGFVALACVLVVSVFVAGRWRPQVVVATALVLGCAVFYFSSVASLPARERVTSVGGGTGRVDIWTTAWRMVEDEPIRGVGAGNFPVSSIHYLLQPGSIERDEFIIDTPKVTHNTYLQVLAEEGIVGAALFLGIILICMACIWRAARRFARMGDERMELLARALFIALIGLLAADFFISEMFSKLLWLLLAVGPPLLAVSARTPEQERRGLEPA